jgi:hypothetical protein
MKNLILATFLLVSPAAFAADCSPAASPSAIFETGSANGWTILTLPPAETAVFAKAYNAIEPVTDNEIDTVMVGKHSAVPVLRVQVFFRGCWLGAIDLTPAQLQPMIYVGPSL